MNTSRLFYSAACIALFAQVAVAQVPMHVTPIETGAAIVSVPEPFTGTMHECFAQPNEEVSLMYFDAAAPKLPWPLLMTINGVQVLAFGQRFTLPTQSGRLLDFSIALSDPQGDTIRVFVYPDTLLELSIPLHFPNYARPLAQVNVPVVTIPSASKTITFILP